MNRFARFGLAFVLGIGGVGLVEPAVAGRPGEEVRVLTWNILHGGLGESSDDVVNKRQTIDQIVAVRPDVFFSVETYGVGPAIVDALSSRAGKGKYYSAQITPGSGQGQDNLWVFSRYPIVRKYPAVSGGGISSFNFGGVRVKLPNGRGLNLFPIWTTYTNPWIGDLIDENANDVVAGRPLRHSATEIEHAERAQLAQTGEILRQLHRVLDGNSDATLVGGDLNTVPSSDWSAANAGCPSHYGQAFDFRTTEQWTDAGFTDTYRAANPDACTAAGRTWSPHEPADLVPQRIDFTFARGNDLRVVGSHTLDQRLSQHGPGIFYSDHAAVVTDLRLD
ncbi:endonuclease/exonuclease/phosphatase family protein [Kribbella sp. NBC_01245]|uniref:endonuclease/exonuclease/phosphatase family protein n=1 Tax=Kribbella sp. NBC_01245 TaxID=2903578 RepID=UPI002E27AB2A|nr:endonuclease/exonuclease/phosphatase family protein [Kribbella sp. NBC_01245]